MLIERHIEIDAEQRTLAAQIRVAEIANGFLLHEGKGSRV
jgi:hypothetical protein